MKSPRCSNKVRQTATPCKRTTLRTQSELVDLKPRLKAVHDKPRSVYVSAASWSISTEYPYIISTYTCNILKRHLSTVTKPLR